MKNMSVKNRITVSFVIFILLPFVGLFFIFYQISSNYAGEMSTNFIESSLSRVEEEIGELYENLSSATRQVYYNGFVDALEETELDQEEIEEYLQMVSNSARNVNAAYFLSEDGFYTYVFRGKYQGIEEYIGRYEEEIEERGGRMVLLPVEEFQSYSGKAQRKFLAARSIYASDYTRLGILAVLIDEKPLKEIFTKNEFLSGSSNFFLTRRGEMVAGTGSITAEDVGALKAQFEPGKIHDTFYTQVNGQESLVVYRQSLSSQWTCLSILPVKDILRDFSSLKFYFLILILIYLMFMAVMFQIINKYIFKPVKGLSQAMDQVSEGDFATRIQIESSGEMNRLAGHFNSMVARIHQLLEKVKREEKEKNDFKMQTLMMQMSPHFIYNSLNTIKWIAVINKQENIRSLIESLIKIFMAMSKHLEDDTTVENEVEMLENYIRIQKARYMNFDVTFDIEEEARRLCLKKFLIQPILENAIVHGISKMKEDGKIHISVRKEEYLKIVVEDNGRGFVEKETEKEEETGKHTKIGIENVKQMIQLEYGTGYGLEIESVPGEGTRAVFTLPIIESPGEEEKE